MSTERRLSRSFHSCLKGSSTEEAADDEETCYHSLGGRHSLNRTQPQVYVEDLTNISLADFEALDENGMYYLLQIKTNHINKHYFWNLFCWPLVSLKNRFTLESFRVIVKLVVVNF